LALGLQSAPLRYEQTAGFPALEAADSGPMLENEPDVRARRTDTIGRSADAIRGQCQAAADGDWDKWQRTTEPFREQLRVRLKALRDYDPPPGLMLESKYEALEGRDGFPLFEVGARDYLEYLYDPQSLERFRQERPVQSANLWLARQGIDLIFVVVPSMTAVHSESFLQPCPADGIVAPHVRRTLLELLDDGVEVVDGLSLFRAVRRPAPDYLFNTCDPHWAPRGMRVMAKEVAERISRYPFGARARVALPLFTALPGPYVVCGELGGLGQAAGCLALSSAQKDRAYAAQTTVQPVVRLYNGQPVGNDPGSAVLVIGNSFVEHFVDQLARETNLRLRIRWGDNRTTEEFGDFARAPATLDGVRVLIWVTIERHLTRFKTMPMPIAGLLDGK
jgi:hypothetical protein